MRAERLRTLGFACLLVATLGVSAYATASAWIARAEAERVAQRLEDLECLARNVYYESRGEPLVGQYAVAEVTMNRVRAPQFPDTVCGVVHARGAFSWTYRSDLADPYGYEWRRARAVAESVYSNIEAPLVNGALFYHATYVSPDWARTKSQVALVGRHLFYL